jgi:hypothetical protein
MLQPLAEAILTVSSRFGLLIFHEEGYYSVTQLGLRVVLHLHAAQEFVQAVTEAHQRLQQASLTYLEWSSPESRFACRLREGRYTMLGQYDKNEISLMQAENVKTEHFLLTPARTIEDGDFPKDYDEYAKTKPQPLQSKEDEQCKRKERTDTLIAWALFTLFILGGAIEIFLVVRP